MEKKMIWGTMLMMLTIAFIQPVACNRYLDKRSLNKQLSFPQGFRLLVVEATGSGDVRLQSGQYFIKAITRFNNWINETGEAYIHLLSRYTKEECIEEAKPYWKDNSTKVEFRDEILTFLANATSNELVVLHYIGFGLPLELHLDEVITASELLSWLGNVNATICLVIDACHSGAMISDGEGGILGPGKIVLCSSRSDQLSWGGSNPYWGLDFTGFESKRHPNGTYIPLGIIGATIRGIDSNGDSWLSCLEIFQYAKLSVEQYAGAQNPVAFNGLPNEYDPQFLMLQPPEPLVANFSYSPQTPWINETITFNATQCYSANGNITWYAWNFEGGNLAATQETMINHTYSSEGKYNVTLEVTDEKFLKASTSNIVTVTYSTDLSKDLEVNIIDIALVAKAFGTKPGDENWDPIADMDKNEIINILDIATVALDYGKTV